MKKYTANYSFSNHNFIFINNDFERKVNKYTPAICIIKNILQRGKPTAMSTFLQETLGAIHKKKDFINSIAFIDKNPPVWKTVIKGNVKKNDFPALEFFNDIPKNFPKLKFIQQLIIPEIAINDITQIPVEQFNNQTVDFYLPQAYLVIEIDGSQHQESRVKDKVRDEYLEKYKIKTIRIDTKDLKAKNKIYENKIYEINKYLLLILNSLALREIKNPKLNTFLNYKESFNKKIINYSEPIYRSTAVMRFQLLILDLIDNGRLSLDKRWDIELYEYDVSGFSNLAIDDIFIWLEHILKLQKISFTKPEYKIKKVNALIKFTNINNIKIDFSLLKRPTDESIYHSSIIFVRTDPLDVYPKIPEGEENKPNRKVTLKQIDHFEISTTELSVIKYKIKLNSQSSDIQSLKKLAWDIFLQHNNNLKEEDADFRDGQIEIIRNCLEGNDTLGLLPTGSGKSICYQLACILKPGISFVVAPIRALMLDQTEDLKSAFFDRVSFINSDLTPQQKTETLDNFQSGKYFFILISPERFQNLQFRESFISVVNKFQISYAVVDEVHCLSEWGHDFRLSYLSLAKTIRDLSHTKHKIIFLGLTATASTKVIKDIQVEFDLSDDNIVTPSSFTRPELNFDIVNDKGSKKNELIKKLKYLIDKHDILTLKDSETKAGIIFTQNVGGVNGCYSISQDLIKTLNQDVRYYSGTKPKKLDIKLKQFNLYKKQALLDFKKNIFSLIVATKSFGMGINKPNIHFTIHYGIPCSMEALYQEGGRAGRDKVIFNKANPAKCITLLSESNIEDEDNLWGSELSVDDFKDKETSGDLETNLYLMKMGLENEKKEFERIKKIFIIFGKSTKTRVTLNGKVINESKTHLENALYKLKQLGYVEDWTISDWGIGTSKGGEFEVTLNKITDEEIKNQLFKTIQKYDHNFTEENINTDESLICYKEILGTSESSTDKYIKIIIRWTYRTFVYARKQSLKTVYENCVKVANQEISSQQFKNSLESYFKFTNTSNVFQQILDGQVDLNDVFQVFYYNHKLLTPTTLESRKHSLSRFLESQNDNIGLNLVSGLLRLLLDEYDNADGRKRLENALQKIHNLSSKQSIMESIIHIGKQCDLKNKNYLSESIYKTSENTYNLFWLNHKLEDTYSKITLLTDMNQKLSKINEEHYGQLRKIR